MADFSIHHFTGVTTNGNSESARNHQKYEDVVPTNQDDQTKTCGNNYFAFGTCNLRF